MTKRPWTPGPWFAGELLGLDYYPDDRTISIGPYDLSDKTMKCHYEDTICEVWDNKNFGDAAEANASLIAAAPELYEALEAMTDALFGLAHGVDWNKGTHATLHRSAALAAIQPAKAALRKATGGAS